MDKGILIQYKDLIREIASLEKRLEKLSNIQVEQDKVTGSNPEFPYEKRNFKIVGYNTDQVDRINRLKRILIDRKIKCEELKIQIEEFISTIPDSRTRSIFQYRYIDQLDWIRVSRKVGGYEESYARKIHDRYLDGVI